MINPIYVIIIEALLILLDLHIYMALYRMLAVRGLIISIYIHMCIA